MFDKNIARLMVNVFDGTRELIGRDVNLFITIRNGFQETIHRDYHKGPSVEFDLPFYNGTGDNYTVLADASGFEGAGLFPVRVNPNVFQHADLMLLPENASFNFGNSRWNVLRKKHPALFTLLSQGAGTDQAAKDRYTRLMEEKAPALACLYNLVTAMSQVFLPQGTPLAYVKGLIWDDTMAQDRLFCYADVALVNQILRADERVFKPAPGSLHPGATRSFKQVEFGEANLQLTLHENDQKTVDGVKCFKLELDMDYFKDPAAHLILEVLKNSVSGSLTDPRTVHVLRWTAGRAANRPEFDPPYVIA